MSIIKNKQDLNQQNKIPSYRIIAHAVGTLFRSTPIHATVSAILGPVHSLTWMLAIIATQNLFDAVATAAGSQTGILDCIIPLLILAAVYIGQQAINGVLNFHWSIFRIKSIGKVKTYMHRKLQRIDPVEFENTKFLDDLNKAQEGAVWISDFGMMILMLVGFYGVYFVSVGAYLWSLKSILLITLLVAFFPALLAQIVKVEIFTSLEKDSAPIRRENEYYQKTLCDREYFKETRILGAYKYFHKLFSETLELLTIKIWKAERKTALLELTLNIATFTGMAISAYLLFDATMSGEISVGAFAAVFASMSNIFHLMQEIVTMHLGNMNKNMGKVANFIRLLDVAERSGVNGTSDFSKGITANCISYTYPGRDEPAVRSVSLTIQDGESVAIVGENGAGKSTFVRLLTGIYRPSDGNVTVGGLDTSKTLPSDIFRSISGVFQKYQRYKMSLRENVEISDSKRASEQSVSKALEDADFSDDSVGFDTMLSPEFDGVDLSGGQWQRIAIARGLYRTNKFIVLDEPTAAIDPIEETKIYQQFQKLAEGKCAIVVTHRLGSAKLAHRVVVMDAGQIVDVGTHDELISREGKYADMWSAQSKWYQRVDI